MYGYIPKLNCPEFVNLINSYDIIGIQETKTDDLDSINIIGIKHGFPFINIRNVPREVLKTEGEARGFQHLPRDLANVNE